MPIDFATLDTPKGDPRIAEPIELFRSLRVTDIAVNDLWLAQGDALRAWHGHRNDEDIAIVLNTGAGKTLVGLLAAQSLVNETAGRVVYACSSVQLVKQTARKAEGYGLRVTTYVEGAFDNVFYHQGQAPCVTTYQALFNGRSHFFREELDAVVFDDAHTAGHILRDQFTLTIKRSVSPVLFSQLVGLYRPYFERIRQGVGYDETYDRSDAGISRFVPPFAVRRNLGELERLLGDAALDQSIKTMFPWRHLQNHLDICAVFVSGTEVAFTPPVVPVLTLPYFRPGIRRLYLSATLGAADDFLRTFGKVPGRTISPSTTAGECERLVLIPALMTPKDSKVGDVAITKTAIKGRKTLVLVPSWRRAEAWEDVATEFEGDFDAKVEAFKTAQPPACLVVAARYDGVDLPGDTCRVLVVDDLPTGMNPMERYMWEQLNLAKLLRSTIASRIVQSFGRISRGMSDHGVVIVTGGKLVEWLSSPKNAGILPGFLQRQLEVGMHVSCAASTPEEFGEAIRDCLDRAGGWPGYYERSMKETQPQEVDITSDAIDALKMTRSECEFGHALWERDYVAAARALEQDLEWTLSASRSTGAWHALWLGVCYDARGDVERASELFERAHGASKEIPPLDEYAAEEVEAYPPQVAVVAALLRQGARVMLSMPPRFDLELSPLDGAATVPQIERSLELLGSYLGLETARPDNEFGTGPDVLWVGPDRISVNFEAKTDKHPEGVYTKNELGQLRDHARWLRDQRGINDIRSVFVGPLRPTSDEANPDPDMTVIELKEFRELRDRLKAALTDICGSATPATVLDRTLAILQERNLLWPDVFDTLSRNLLVDLRYLQ